MQIHVSFAGVINSKDFKCGDDRNVTELSFAEDFNVSSYVIVSATL